MILLSILGVGCSLLYGYYGGSGGETTEGVYFGLAITAFFNLLLGVIILFYNFSWFRWNIVWYLPVLIFLFFITKGYIVNVFLNYIPEVEPLPYEVKVSVATYDSAQAELNEFLKSNQDSISIDTILFSENSNKLLAVCVQRKVNAQGNYSNIEVLGEKTVNVWNFHIPRTGTFITFDSVPTNIGTKSLMWYLKNYSFDEHDSSSIWSDTYLWR
jgi:hypothetical protein